MFQLKIHLALQNARIFDHIFIYKYTYILYTYRQGVAVGVGSSLVWIQTASLKQPGSLQGNLN